MSCLGVLAPKCCAQARSQPDPAAMLQVPSASSKDKSDFTTKHLSVCAAISVRNAMRKSYGNLYSSSVIASFPAARPRGSEAAASESHRRRDSLCRGPVATRQPLSRPQWFPRVEKTPNSPSGPEAGAFAALVVPQGREPPAAFLYKRHAEKGTKWNQK